MLNVPEFYYGLGCKAAEARNQRDEARSKFHRDHFTRARNLEQGEDRTIADALYAEGYKAERIVPTVSYFK